MGIGPQGLGSMGMKKGVHGCGSPMKKMDGLEIAEKKVGIISPLTKKDTCWDGYKAQGQKKSPSGKKTASGKAKMVNNCVKV